MDHRLLILALATFAIGTDNYVVAGILPQVAGSFNVTSAAAGQFVTAYSLSYAIATPVLATLTANWSRKRVLLVGLAVFVAGNILTITQHLFWLALVSRAVAAAGAAVVTPAAGAAAAAIVPADRRGGALAVVLAGLSAATAFGAPIGTLIASVGDWRTPIWFIAAIGILAFASMAVLVPALSPSAPMTMTQRLEPIGNPGVRAALLTTFVPMFGIFLTYTYITLVFDRATGGHGSRLALLMSVWGGGATAGILFAGRVCDRLGNRRVINVCLAAAACDFALMRWSSASYLPALLAVALWGVFGWGSVVSQQHRLVSFSPALAPVLIALNASAIYLAVSMSGAVGALLLAWIDPHNLPLIGAVLIASGLISAERAYRLLNRPNVAPPNPMSGSVAEPTAATDSRMGSNVARFCCSMTLLPSRYAEDRMLRRQSMSTLSPSTHNVPFIECRTMHLSAARNVKQPISDPHGKGSKP